MKNIITILLLALSLSAFAASPVFTSFNTNQFSANATNNTVSIPVGLKLTNATISQIGNSYAIAALNLVSSSNNTDSGTLLIGEVGTTGAAIIEFTNNVGMQVDQGLWASAFGSGFSNNFMTDLYNRVTPNTNAVPYFETRWSGHWNANGGFAGDNGFVQHTVVKGDPIAGTYEINNMDGTHALFINMFSNGPTAFNVAGSTIFSVSQTHIAGTWTSDSSTPTTLTVGGGGSIVGTLTPGDIVVNTNSGSLGLVEQTNTTTVTVVNLAGGVFSITATGMDIQKASFHSPGLLRSGYGFVVDSAGDPMVYRPSGTAYSFIGAGASLWSLAVGSTDKNFRIHSWQDNADPIAVKNGSADGTFQTQPYGSSFRGTFSNDQANPHLSSAVPFWFTNAGVSTVIASNTIVSGTVSANTLSGSGSGITNLNGDTFSITATNRLYFTTVSSLTNTLGREATAIVTAGTSVALQDTNGVSIATIGTVATLDVLIPMHVNMRVSGTGVSAILY